MGNELFDSITSKLATQVPLLAKALVTQGLEQVGASPYSVTPYQMKRALDDYILPRLHAYGKGSQPIDCIGEGVLRTGPEGEILEMSPVILHFLGLEPKGDKAPETVREALFASGVLHPADRSWDPECKCLRRKVELPPPNSRTLEVLITPILNAAEDVAELRYLVRDITLSEGLLREIFELHQDLEKKVEERTTALRETERIGSLLVRELDRDRVLTRITEEAARLVEAESVFVTMISEDGGSYYYPAACGLDADLIIGGELPMEIGLCGWVLRNKRPLRIDDMAKDPRVVAGGALKRRIRSAIYVPLFRQGEITGGLAAIGKKGDRRFSEADLHLLNIFAVHASIAIENAALYSDLKQSKEFLETIVNGVGVGILVLDPEMRIITANETVEAMSGRDRTTLLGEHCYGVFHGLASPCPECPARETFASGKPAQGTSTGRNREGSEIHVEVNTYPLFNTSGEVIQVIETAKDVTELRRLEQERADHIMELRRLSADLERKVRERTAELERANLILRELDHKKTDFLNIVAHDLRTPLTSIISYADLLLRYRDEPRGRREEFLNIIKAEGLRLGNLINDYLDMSKIEAGLLDFHPEPLSFREVLGHCGTLFEGQSAAREITFTIRFDPAGSPRIQGDRQRLIQAMVNLLSNAFKFTPRGGTVALREERLSPEKAARLRLPDYVVPLTDPGEMVCLRISNSGSHIPEEYQPRIFEKFEQAPDSSPESEKGTGLGLPIAKSIIEGHQGRLWVESRPETGPTFVVLLPLASRTSAIPR